MQGFPFQPEQAHSSRGDPNARTRRDPACNSGQARAESR